MADNNNNNNAAAQQEAPMNGVANALLRGVVMYMAMNTFQTYMHGGSNKPMTPAATTGTGTPAGAATSSNPAGTNGKMKPRGALDLNYPGMKPGSVTQQPRCLWGLESIFDLHVYITNDQDYPATSCDPASTNFESTDKDKDNEVLAEWHESDLVFGSTSEAVTVRVPSEQGNSSNGNKLMKIENKNHRNTNITIPVTQKVQFNQTHIYAHVCMVRKLSSMSKVDETPSKDILVKTVQLTEHRKRKRIRDEKNLLSSNDESKPSTSDDNDNTTLVSLDENAGLSPDASPLTVASANTTQDAVLLYLKPSLSLQLVNLKGLPTFPERKGIPKAILEHMSWYNDTDHNNPSALYYPLAYHSEFWILKSSLTEVNDTIDSANLEVTIDDISFWKWQLMSQMEESWRKQAELTGEDDDSGTDMIRTMLLETNPILLAVTVLVSVLHSIFDILAFKNDIHFFKGKKSMVGLSLQSMIINTVFQLVILLYLMDNETSFMVLVSNGVSLVIEVWKISKVVKVSLFDESGKLSFKWKESDTYSKSSTKEYDEIATSHLMYITMPLVSGYGLYSLFNQKHKGWYSWILNTLVGFIYMFGFVMMTPQLFINYKLQSVAHLNWRTMTYKSINTFIDDLFAFVIKMPIMHRLACLRDDVIFLIFCYQRYKYRTDFTRVNEFGQCTEPTEEMIQESKMNKEDEKSTEEINSHQASTTTRKERRGAREKK